MLSLTKEGRAMQWTPSYTWKKVKTGMKIPVFYSSSIPRDPGKKKKKHLRVQRETRIIGER